MAASPRLAAMVLVATVGGAAAAVAQPQVVFHGRPSLKVSEGALERLPTMLNETTGAPLEVVITEENGQYFWASRRNTPMGVAESESFVTFVALNGGGYVRVKKTDLTTTDFPVTPTEEQFDYVEHIPLGLNSVIYYGTRVDDPGP